MIDDILIFDDIIDKKLQDSIENKLLSDSFPWYYCDDVSIKGNKLQKRPGFKHHTVLNREVRSKFHNEIIPIIINSLKKVNYKSPELVKILQGRSFLQLPLNLSDADTVDTPHIDLKYPHLVILYYVVDNEANTIIYENKFKKGNIPTWKDLKIQQKVKPKKGRVVVFSGEHWHTAEQPRENVRCIINYDVV